MQRRANRHTKRETRQTASEEEDRERRTDLLEVGELAELVRQRLELIAAQCELGKRLEAGNGGIERCDFVVAERERLQLLERTDFGRERTKAARREIDFACVVRNHHGAWRRRRWRL